MLVCCLSIHYESLTRLFVFSNLTRNPIESLQYTTLPPKLRHL